jgi:hypothetical protein
MRPSKILFSIAALAVTLQAQCYEPMTGTSIGSGDDVVLPMQSLGFVFPFGTSTYTDVHVSTNGFVYLSNAGFPAPGGSNYSASAATLVAGSPMIAPYWSDLTSFPTGDIKFNALPGKAVITWDGYFEFSNTVPFSVQLTLSDTGEIDFAYDGHCEIRTGGDFIVGMSEGGGAAIPGQSDFAVTLGSSTTTTTYEVFNINGPQFDLTGKTVQIFPASGGGFLWLPQACAAVNTSYGAGCYSISDSVYERFADAALASAALSNQSIRFTPSGASYQVSWGGGTFVAPSGGAVNLAPGAGFDDGEVVVTPSLAMPTPQGPQASLRFHTNGVLSWGAAAQTFPGSNAYTPTAPGFLNGANAGIYAWHDYNETEPGSGRIVQEEVSTAGGTVLYVTWNNVENYPYSPVVNPTTMQMQCNLSTGEVTIVWTNVDSDPSSSFGSATLVGYSPPGASVDGGPIDLATVLPIMTNPTNLAPLGLGATLAVVNSSVDYTTTGIPEYSPGAGVYIAINIISFGQIPAPGADLGFLGAPGCAALISGLDIMSSTISTTDSATVSLSLPSPIVMQGDAWYSQSVALFSPNSLPNGENAFGLTTSNAIWTVVGAW